MYVTVDILAYPRTRSMDAVARRRALKIAEGDYTRTHIQRVEFIGVDRQNGRATIRYTIAVSTDA